MAVRFFQSGATDSLDQFRIEVDESGRLIAGWAADSGPRIVERDHKERRCPALQPRLPQCSEIGKRRTMAGLYNRYFNRLRALAQREADGAEGARASPSSRGRSSKSDRKLISPLSV